MLFVFLNSCFAIIILKGGDLMNDMDNFWKSINKIQKQVRKLHDDLLPKDSQLRSIANQSMKTYKSMQNQLPKGISEYQNSQNKHAFQNHLKDLQTFNDINKIGSPKIKDIQSFLKNIQEINNPKLNSQIKEMTKLFGSPGSELTDYQKENIYNLESNFSFDEFYDVMSEDPYISENSNSYYDLKQFHDSNPTGDIKSQVDINRNPNPEKEIPDKIDTVSSTLSKEDFKYFNRFSGNNIYLLPWSILFNLISAYIGSVDSPMPIMIISFTISATSVLISNAKK